MSGGGGGRRGHAGGPAGPQVGWPPGLAEAVPVGLVMLDLEGRVTAWNPAAERIFGWSEREALGRPDPVHGGNRGELRRWLARLSPDGRAGGATLQRRRKDGTRIWVRVTAVPLPGPGGEPAGVLEVVEDVTEEVVTARALEFEAAVVSAGMRAAREEELMRTVCRAAVERAGYRLAWAGRAGPAPVRAVLPVAVAGLDRSYVRGLGITWGPGPGGEGPTGTAIRERRVVVCHDIATDPAFAAWRETARERGYGSSAAVPIPRREGEVWGTLNLYASEPRAFPERAVERLEELGRELGLALAAVEGRRRLESELERNRRLLEELEAARRTLERRVRERTAALEAANRELEAFVDVVSHDLRAPLRAIGGFTRILEEELGPSLGEGTRGHLARVRRAAARMGEMIDALLELSRIGRRPLRRRRVDLSALARELLEELTAGEAGRRFEIEVAAGLAAEADPVMARILLQNLLANAVKFTSGRDPAVIEVGRERSTGADAFFVRDNGVGFDPERAERLFGMFQRLHPPGRFPGLGVGLATARRVVERHGGRLWAESAHGRGAVFRFTLGEDGPEG